MADLLPLGLHFGLQFDKYLVDPGLGSGDIRQLGKNASSWWWNSRFNPKRPKPPAKEKHHNVVGRAIHKLLLEGEAALEEEFICGPSHDSALSAGEKGAVTRKFNASMVGSGKTPLKAEDYERIFHYVDAIKRNEHIKGAFVGGQYEVSAFWEREGVRLKGRYDCLKVMQRPGFMLAANGDVKSVENKYDEDFKKVCRDHIADYGYDAQAAHYMDGLSRTPGMVDAGAVAVHAGNLPDQEWLRRFLAEDIRYAWQWVFIQKNNMPLVWSYFMTPGMNGQPGSPIFEEGASKVNVGLQRYLDCMDRFGPDKPWDVYADEAPQELAPEEMPHRYGYGRN